MSMPFTLHRRHFLKSTAAALALMAAGVDPVAAATLAQKERRFIENLLRRMTIEEKAGQLSLFTAPFSVQVNPVTGPPARVREVQAQVRAGGDGEAARLGVAHVAGAVSFDRAGTFLQVGEGPQSCLPDFLRRFAYCFGQPFFAFLKRFRLFTHGGGSCISSPFIVRRTL